MKSVFSKDPSTKVEKKEILRAITFFINQYRKGYTPQEAMLQMRSSYGMFISGMAERHIERSIMRWKI